MIHAQETKYPFVEIYGVNVNQPKGNQENNEILTDNNAHVTARVATSTLRLTCQVTQGQTGEGPHPGRNRVPGGDAILVQTHYDPRQSWELGMRKRFDQES